MAVNGKLHLLLQFVCRRGQFVSVSTFTGLKTDLRCYYAPYIVMHCTEMHKVPLKGYTN